MTENEIIQAEVVEEKSTDIMEIDVDDIFDFQEGVRISKKKLQIFAKELAFENKPLKENLKVAGISKESYYKYIALSPKFENFIKRTMKIKKQSILNEIFDVSEQMKGLQEPEENYERYSKGKNRKRYHDKAMLETRGNFLLKVLESISVGEERLARMNSTSNIKNANIINVTVEDAEGIKKLLGGFE